VQPMKGLVVFGVAALVIAGCGANEKSAATVPVAATTTVADPTAVTATSVPSSTSTTAAVAETTTLAATTTTVATENLIKQAVQDYFEAYQLCGATPASCNPETFTAEQGHSRATVAELAAGMTAQGLYFSTDLRGSYLVAESVSLVSPSEATATFCAYDAATVLGPNGPDGLPTVVNDEILSLRNEYRLYWEDNQWQVGEQREIQDLGRGSLCPSAG
jgi:hypothetical protein